MLKAERPSNSAFRFQRSAFRTCRVTDSNRGRHRQRIYSPPPLATRATRLITARTVRHKVILGGRTAAPSIVIQYSTGFGALSSRYQCYFALAGTPPGG